MKTILVDALDTFVIEGEGIYQPIHDLLETYENPKVIVSNADDTQMEEWGLNSMPYEVFTLKHEPDKTDPVYFKTLLERLGLSKDDAVYFEHNPEAVQSARSLGIVSYHYDSEKRDIEALKHFLSQSLS